MWHVAFVVKRDLHDGVRTKESHVRPRYIASECLFGFVSSAHFCNGQKFL